MSDIVGWLCAIDNETPVDTFSNGLDRLCKKYPSDAEEIKYDAFSMALVKDNLPICKHCYANNFDLFVQGKRFQTTLYKKMGEKSKSVEWLFEQLDDLDAQYYTEWSKAIHNVRLKIPNCKCDECNDRCDDSLDDSPDFLGSNHSKKKVESYLKWATNHKMSKDHDHQKEAFITAANKYLKYINRRFC